jgi:hypothetical protein
VLPAIIKYQKRRKDFISKGYQNSLVLSLTVAL